MFLPSKAKEVTLNCKVEVLNQENRMDTLITTLDDLYLKDSIGIQKLWQLSKTGYDVYTKQNLTKDIQKV